MPAVTLGSTDLSGFNMLAWSTGQIINLVRANFGNNTTTQLHYDAGTTEVFIFGTFGDFDQFGDPHSGTITSFTFNTDVLGATDTITVTGLSLNMATVYTWIFPGPNIEPNYAALHNAVFGAADSFTGSAGDDLIMGYGGADTINGGAGSDEIYGEAHPFSSDAAPAAGDTLNGEGGNDVLYGGAGNDTLTGGVGNDAFNWVVGDGRDTISGGADFDIVSLTGSAAADVADANWNGSVIT
ncbi:MAG TPA: hypothetical protein VJ748_05100, partial [Vitreimonas sp.]|nr:hypothetical protein [Vitreimonas sp.]